MRNQPINNNRGIARRLVSAGMFGCAIGAIEVCNAIHEGEIISALPRGFSLFLINSACAFAVDTNPSLIGTGSLLYSMVTFCSLKRIVFNTVLATATASLCNPEYQHNPAPR